MMHITVTRKGGRISSLACLAALLAVTVAISAIAFAQTGGGESTEAAEGVPKTGLGQGEFFLLDEIARYFGVEVEALQALRGQGLGMGEIVLLYSLAASAPGDTLEERVASVLGYREEGLGWGEIAHRLGIHPSSLGQAVADVLRGPKDQEQPAPEAVGTGAEQQMRLREQLRQRQEERLKLVLSVERLLPEQARAEMAPLAQELQQQLASFTAVGGPSGGGAAKGAKALGQGAGPSGSAGGDKGNRPEDHGGQAAGKGSKGGGPGK